MDRKKEIKKELERLAELRNELNVIEHEEQAEINKKLIGHCYKYRNSYSCPEGPGDYWYIYAKMIGLTEDGFLEAIRFQIDKHGRIEVERENDYSNHYERNWQRIDSAEYMAALESTRTRIEFLFDMAAAA